MEEVNLDEEIIEIIHLNKIEALTMIKEYLLTYMYSVISDLEGRNQRIILMNKLKEYLSTIKCENNYLNQILSNLNNMSELEVNNFLNKLDRLNEKTYIYYDNILKEYEDNIYYGDKRKNFIPYKNFKNINESDNILNDFNKLLIKQ
jgi:hypothetical protein